MGILCGSTDTHHTLDTLPAVFCPVCQQPRSIKVKEVWRSCTFFFVPLKGHTKLAAYYKCQTCKTRMPLMNWSAMTPHGALEHILLVCMVRVRMANGRFRLKEAATVQKVYASHMPEAAVPPDTIIMIYAVYMNKVSRNGIEEDLRQDLVQMLTDEDKQLIVRAMKAVSLAEINAVRNKKEEKVMEQVKKIFGLPP